MKNMKAKLRPPSKTRQKVDEATLAANLKAKVQAQADIKERQSVRARELSSNPNEAVEKSLAKSSSDEVRPTSR